MRLEKYTFSHIHAVILSSNSKTDAAKILGIQGNAMQAYLSKFTHHDEKLSYERLKNISIDEMNLTHTNYYEPWYPKIIRLQDLPFSEIHKSILSSKNEAVCAANIGVEHRTLQRYLHKFKQNETPLSYRRLKKISASHMQILYPNYHQPWKADNTKLQKLTLSHIHDVILSSQKQTDAAVNLGVGATTLERYLNKFQHNGTELSYKRLKAISALEMSNSYPDYYSLNTTKKPSKNERLEAPATENQVSNLHNIPHNCETLPSIPNPTRKIYPNNLANIINYFSHRTNVNFHRITGSNIYLNGVNPYLFTYPYTPRLQDLRGILDTNDTPYHIDEIASDYNINATTDTGSNITLNETQKGTNSYEIDELTKQGLEAFLEPDETVKLDNFDDVALQELEGLLENSPNTTHAISRENVSSYSPTFFTSEQGRRKRGKDIADTFLEESRPTKRFR